MTPDRAPCGCPWDGIACPHCGRGENADHIRRHHQTATGYPVQGNRPRPEPRPLRFKTPCPGEAPPDVVEIWAAAEREGR